MKALLTILLIAVVLCGLALSINTRFSVAQTGTQVSGTINNTTWTKTNSPYNLTADVLVATGVNLTLEAGTTVNLNAHNIQVDGVLQVLGNNADNIVFNNGQITFSKSSTSWNQQTGFGCIIQNAILNATTIEINSAPKINNNTFQNYPTNSAINVIRIPVGSPIISNNTISGVGTYILIWCGGSATISNNTLIGGDYAFQLDGNFAYGLNSGAVNVSNNVVDSLFNINNYCSGTIIVERNLITGLYVGINDQATIQNNTIINGIYLQTNQSTITYNNILHNDTSYSVYNNDGSAILPYNWWGTTDPNAIEQSVYNKYIPTVNFSPFLSSPNLQAPPIPANIIYPTPTPSPAVSEFPTWVILPLLMILVLIMGLCLMRRKMKTLNKHMQALRNRKADR